MLCNNINKLVKKCFIQQEFHKYFKGAKIRCPGKIEANLISHLHSKAFFQTAM